MRQQEYLWEIIHHNTMRIHICGELDNYIKRILKVKYYVRYMDNFVLLLNSKKECKEKLKNIKDFLEKNLELELNTSTNYFHNKNGLTFCGFRIFSSHILLKNSNKRSIKRRVNKWNKKYKNKELDILNTMQSFNSWLGHSSHCNSYKLVNKIINSCDFINSQNTDYEMEKHIIELISKDSQVKTSMILGTLPKNS